jgi:hypothetical protein
VAGESGELAGTPRAQGRTAHDMFELQAAQRQCQRTRLLFTIFGERNVGGPGMLSGQRPGRFAVAHQIKPKRSRRFPDFHNGLEAAQCKESRSIAGL